MATDLVTLAEYKAYQKITSTNQDAEIKQLIPIASQLCKTYCRRTFLDYINDNKVEFSNGGGSLIYLKEFPLLSVSSVEYSTDFGATYTALIEFTDYIVDMEDGSIVPTSGNFTKVLNGYRITYSAGFEVLPDDLKVAVMDLITYYLKNDMAVKSSRGAGANTVQIEYITKNTLPAHIVRVFDMYLANVS